MYEFLDYVVSDAMTREPVCVAPGASLASVEQLLEQHGWNALPVVEDGRLVGLVTSLDLLKAFRFTPASLFPPYEQIMTRPVRQIMRENVQTVAPGLPLPRALERMVRPRKPRDTSGAAAHSAACPRAAPPTPRGERGSGPCASASPPRAASPRARAQRSAHA